MALTKDITCYQAVALMSDYLEGALTRRERRRLEKHLSSCGACSAYLAQMRATIELAGSVGPEDLSDEALDELSEVFDRYQREKDGEDPDT
jgi:anti-sigma factor RsiW